MSSGPTETLRGGGLSPSWEELWPYRNTARGRVLTQLGAGAAVDVVDVVAVLPLVVGVGVVEAQAVTAGLQGGHAVLACPVLIAAGLVREEAGQLVRARERFLAQACGAKLGFRRRQAR